MATDVLASLLFGTLLVLVGAALIRWHLRVWKAQHGDKTLTDGEIRHYRAQFRRRLQVSCLLIVLGVLIPVVDLLMTRGQLSKVAALLSILGMLLIALWIVLLALLDWVSSRVHRRALLGSLETLDRKRRELEEEVIRLRHRDRNGRG